MVNFTEEQLTELKSKGIEARCEYEETLREIHITFSKDNKHYRRIIPYEDISNYFSRHTIRSVIIEAEIELSH